MAGEGPVKRLLLALCLLAAPVAAQEPVSDKPPAEPAPAVEVPQAACEGTCVPPEDMKKIVEVLKQRKCLDEEPPEFDLDEVSIVIDKDGRVFFSGAAPHPYTLRMHWCGYEVEAQGKVTVVAAIKEPPIWGFRFRPKAYLGLLPTQPVYDLLADETVTFSSMVDAGLMVDFLHYKWANLNAAVGFRSIGGGVGVDITSNFGAYTGYALTWGVWQHNALTGLWFSFWNP